MYQVVDGDELGKKDGRTEYTEDTVIITVKRSIHDKANFGDGRTRMTLAHELGHAVLHYGVPMYRGSNDRGTTLLSRINASESAEHQAKVFASAFLIDDTVAVTLSSAEDISLEFGVSLEAAQICFERLAVEAEKAEARRRVVESNQEFQERMRKGPAAETPHYLGDPCTACGEFKLIPMGIKVMCLGCGAICDPH